MKVNECPECGGEVRSHDVGGTLPDGSLIVCLVHWCTVCDWALVDDWRREEDDGE